jgi:predicted ATP-binding protein involved in virulence
MQIQKISISGLFGTFDHVISLNSDDRITIIHGPNGFGKTVLLRMLNGLFNSNYSVFWSVPFTKFQVNFDDHSAIEVSKSFNKLGQIDNIIFGFYDQFMVKERFFALKGSKDSIDVRFSFYISREIPELGRITDRTWQYLPTGEVLALDEIIDRFGETLVPKLPLTDEPEWFANLKNNVQVRLIESQRLFDILPNVSHDRSSRVYAQAPPILPTVAAYSKEIAQLIQAKLAEYGTTSQSLDRSFPARVVQQQRSLDLTDEQLRHQLNALEDRRSRLIEVGLLNKDESSGFQIETESIDEGTRNILSVYVADVEQKLNVFNEIADKIDLLRTLINNKFAYSYKEISFNKEKGFVFKTSFDSVASDSSSLPSRETLSPTDLSSGEQHQLVLLYELLFKVQPNTLVLIDEPELSLHVGWQTQFLQDLQEITKLADLDILMATHSPDIIQDRWDWTVELKGSGK